MIFATDLDRTLIFSKKFIESEKDITCVEINGQDAPISYITNKALKQLHSLLEQGVCIVPVTTRSVAQYQRIQLSNLFEYAITTNGGTILRNGSPYEPWEHYIKNNLLVKNQHYIEVIQMLKKLPHIYRQPSKVDGKYLFAKTRDVAQCNVDLTAYLNPEIWNFTIQGDKVYVIPKGISKSQALKYLMQEIKETTSVGAGDGKLDVDLLEFVDYPITPAHGEIHMQQLSNRSKIHTLGSGMTFTEDMLRLVKALYIHQSGAMPPKWKGVSTLCPIVQ